MRLDGVVKKVLRSLIVLLIGIGLSVTTGAAETTETTYTPLKLKGGTVVMFISPKRWLPLVKTLAATTEDIHKDYYHLFGNLPKFQSTISLMEEEEFFELTNAPRWTNALFYKGEIILPIDPTKEIDLPRMERSLRHEYTHAITYALSGSRCPAWIDEGLAQWAEGHHNPKLLPALAHYLQENDPIKLKDMRAGFTKMNKEMVPAAYAQSLVVTKWIINNHGFEEIRNYFNMLKTGHSYEKAFEKTFNLTQSRFEQGLARAMFNWSEDY